MKMWGWSLSCSGSHKIWEIARLEGTFWGKLHVRPIITILCVRGGRPREKGILDIFDSHAILILSLDTRHGDLDVGAFHVFFQSCFDMIITYYVPLLPFWNGNIYSVLLYFRKFVLVPFLLLWQNSPIEGNVEKEVSECLGLWFL